MDDPDKGCTPIAVYREAIRDERKIRITYRDKDDVETCRTLRPLVLLYYQECTVLAAWCELRAGFRYFRTDRIWACAMTDDCFAGQGATLRRLWEDSDQSWVPFVSSV